MKKVRNDEIVECYQPLGYFLQWIKNIDVDNTVQEIFQEMLWQVHIKSMSPLKINICLF